MAGMADSENRKFCGRPWTMMEVHKDGSAFVCCPRFSDNKSIGNVLTATGDAIWNSPDALKFRQGVLDGSFSMCNATKCPLLASGVLPDRDDVVDPYLRGMIDGDAIRVTGGPRHVKLATDDSCNLTCPSCRAEPIVADRERSAALKAVFDERIRPLLADCRILDLAGDGDPFSSRFYLQIMRETADLFPEMKISLHTHGGLADAAAWEENRLYGRVDTVQISIDAATEETYRVLRRGGDFSRLMGNLHFLSGLRDAGEIRDLMFVVVVQTRNYREMPEIVRLARRLGVDLVRFMLIDHWPRGQTDADFRANKVWDCAHPEHADFLEVLRTPILAASPSHLGDVMPFRRKAMEDVPAASR